MSVIALAGVSGSGKTTLMNELVNKLDGCAGVEEATRGDILKYCNLPVKALEEFTLPQLVKYDIGRVELSLYLEREFLKGNYKHIVFEKPVIIPLLYFLQYTSRFSSNKVISGLVDDVIDHAKNYDITYYLPVNLWDTSKDGLNRTVTDTSVLLVQGAALIEILNWLDKEYLDLPYNIALRSDQVLRHIKNLPCTSTKKLQ